LKKHVRVRNNFQIHIIAPTHTRAHAHTHTIHPQPTAPTQDGFHENKSIFIKSQYQW